jgi:hypothetical protein
MPSPRTRSLTAALALAATLASGCAAEPLPHDDPREVVPSTLAPRPTAAAQPRIRLDIAEPMWILNGYATSSGQQVWEQSLALARDWMLRPDLVMSHKVRADELDGLGDEMTQSAAAQWQRDVHRALKPWIVRDRRLAHRPKAELALAQLVLWNVNIGSLRGWANPMFSTARVSNGRVIGADGLGVMYTLRTSLRLRGQGLEYEIPYETTLVLIWKHIGGDWKLSSWKRTAILGKEKLVGPPEAVKSSRAAEAQRSAQPQPTQQGEPRPTVLDSAP